MVKSGLLSLQLILLFAAVALAQEPPVTPAVTAGPGAGQSVEGEAPKDGSGRRGPEAGSPQPAAAQETGPGRSAPSGGNTQSREEGSGDKQSGGAEDNSQATSQAAGEDRFDLTFDSHLDSEKASKSFFENVLDFMHGHPIPLVVAAILWLMRLVLAHLLKGSPGFRRLKSPGISIYGFFVAFFLAAIFNIYSTGFGRIFFLVSLTAITLTAVQLSGVIVVDLFMARRKIHVPVIIRDLLVIVIFVIALFVVLGNEGVNLTAILASAGFVGIVLGLAMQDTMGNIISGLALQMEKPFDVGDVVKFDQYEGRVVEINWRSVKLENISRETISVPNTLITKGATTNLCKPTMLLRRSTTIGLPYEAPPNKIKKAVVEALSRVPSVLSDPPPQVLLSNFSSYSIEYKVTYFIKDIPRREAISDEVNVKLWYALKRNGIPIPFPIQDITVRNFEAEAASDGRAEEFVERTELLAGIPFFSPIPYSDIEYLAKRARLESFAAGEEVVRQGDSGASFFVVREGVAVVLGRDEENGTTVEVARFGRGDFFGEMSLMTGERRTATVAASVDTEFLVIDRESFREVINRNPESVERITELVVERRLGLRKGLAEEAERRALEAQASQEKETVLKRIKNLFRIT